MRTEFFIPYNVPSSKNSKRIVGGKNKKARVISSEITLRYRDKVAVYFLMMKKDFINALKGKEKPYKIGFHFVRDSRRKYDWANALQTVTDIMTTHGWIDDDNIFEIVPFPYVKNGGYTTLNTKNAGVYIKIF